MRILMALLMLAPAATLAQDETPPPSPPPPCSSEEHRQFDFWLGEWDVTQNGQPAGHNRIERVENDCVLTETWRSAAGNFTGRSLNLYDRARKTWHQTWVDTGGTLLLLEGGFENGRMVMSGTRPGPNGTQVTDRITWTPNPDGSVRQLWESSSDGTTWTTAFDGLYVKVSEE